MITKILRISEKVRTSFWFLPALMVVASMVLSYFFVVLDRKSAVESLPFIRSLFTGGPEGARSVLATIAASMISIAGMTFSITIVALALASSQYGPRLLRNFMKDSKNQFVLGTFIATFIYCLLVLRTVQTVDEQIFVPRISVVFSLVLALANVGVLIFFIHHISTSIQADHLIVSVYKELVDSIKRLYPEEIGQNPEKIDEPSIDKMIYQKSESLRARTAGYLEAINEDGLLCLAKENDLVLHINYKPGEFIVQGSKVITVNYRDELEDNVRSRIVDTFVISWRRSPTQDAEFAIYQLVEIAARALSTGINDPFTAITCIDRLSSALCILVSRDFPSPYRYDDEERLRVIAKPITFEGIVNAAFDQIRQYGRTNVAITIRLLEALTNIADQARLPDQKRVLKREADMIYQISKDSLPEMQDVKDVEERYNLFINTLKDHN